MLECLAFGVQSLRALGTKTNVVFSITSRNFVITKNPKNTKQITPWKEPLSPKICSLRRDLVKLVLQWPDVTSYVVDSRHVRAKDLGQIPRLRNL